MTKTAQLFSLTFMGVFAMSYLKTLSTKDLYERMKDMESSMQGLDPWMSATREFYEREWEAARKEIVRREDQLLTQI
jgi:hypothetical protein